MMFYVDALTWRFGNLISHHIAISAFLISCDCTNHTCAYAATKFSDIVNIKITETDNPSSDKAPLLTDDVLLRFSQDRPTHSPTDPSLYPSSSSSITELPTQMRPSPNLCKIFPLHDYVTTNTAIATLHIYQSLKFFGFVSMPL